MGEKFGGVGLLEVNSAFLLEGEEGMGFLSLLFLKNLERGGALHFLFFKNYLEVFCLFLKGEWGHEFIYIYIYIYIYI